MKETRSDGLSPKFPTSISITEIPRSQLILAKSETVDDRNQLMSAITQAQEFPRKETDAASRIDGEMKRATAFHTILSQNGLEIEK